MRIIWDDLGSHMYENGVDQGVFYPNTGEGVPWNGLVSVGELESDMTNGKIIFIDGNKYNTELGIGNFAAIISAVTYPDEFEKYNGYDVYAGRKIPNQRRKSFNFSYRSNLANEVKNIRGYLIHLVYNAIATPSIQDNNSLNNALTPFIFTWGISTTPIVLPYARATSHFIIDTSKAYPETISGIEDMLYGTNLLNPRMPPITEVLQLFEDNAIFKVIPQGNGVVRVIGPDTAVQEISPNLWKLDWPTVVQVAEHTYHLSSF